MHGKPISVLDVFGHQMILLDQAEGQDFLEIIPDRIGISGEVANFFGVCQSYVTMDTCPSLVVWGYLSFSP